MLNPSTVLARGDSEELDRPEAGQLSESLPAERTLAIRKKNGIFYTPTRATQVLSDWAIRDVHDTILEPSFGGCGFLAAVRKRLDSLGSANPEEHLCGCDVDLAAFRILADLLPGSDPSQRFLPQDFLQLSPTDFPVEGFTVVIGNPPYVSLHNMEEAQRATARKVAEDAGVELSKKASLWAYFVVHSLSFLRRGGRMAWILPGSFVHAEYSTALREVLSRSFARSVAIQLEERLFLTEGTEENSVVLLCEGYQAETPSAVQLARAEDLDELERLVGAWADEQWSGVEWTERPQLALLPLPARQVWDRVANRGRISALKDWMSFRIGIVTGANRFFVINDDRARALDLPSEVLKPIVAKFAQCAGLQLTTGDLVNQRVEGTRCLLVDTSGASDLSGALERYLTSFPQDRREENKTFTKRPVWHQPNDGIQPAGFFSSMQTDGPTLVLNRAGVTCTNTVYRVSFRPDVAEGVKAGLAVAVQSTYSQLSAEIEGRSYGSGGLKIEPSEAGRILVLAPDRIQEKRVAQAFARVDGCLRAGDRIRARQLADEFLIDGGLVSPDEVKVLESALAQLRRSRRGSRRARK